MSPSVSTLFSINISIEARKRSFLLHFRTEHDSIVCFLKYPAGNIYFFSSDYVQRINVKNSHARTYELVLFSCENYLPSLPSRRSFSPAARTSTGGFCPRFLFGSVPESRGKEIVRRQMGLCNFFIYRQ